jgi:hypothetical protein
MDNTDMQTHAHYVLVYHETTTAALVSIMEHGLDPFSEERNIGAAPEVARLNEAFDRDRPEYLKDQGVSRVHNIFAYPSLERGFSLGFAAQRYVQQPTAIMRQKFEALAEHDPEVLKSMGVRHFHEYERLMKDPQYLRQTYPGEVLELKVDPAHTFVGDLAIYTDIAIAIDTAGGICRLGDTDPYWQSIITLNDFQKWYLPESSSDGRDVYVKDPAAPDALPASIASPEILIPDRVPAVHIRVLP